MVIISPPSRVVPFQMAFSWLIIIGVTNHFRVVGPDPPSTCAGFRWRSLAFRTAWQQSLSWQWKLFGWWEVGQSFYHLCCLEFHIFHGLNGGNSPSWMISTKNLPWKHIPNSPFTWGIQYLPANTSRLRAEALAGGSGITPVLSLLRQCREECRSSFAKPNAKSDLIKEFSIIHAMRSMDERHMDGAVFLGRDFKN